LGASLGILANTEYVVSVSTGPNGYYAATAGFFTTSLVNGDLTALAVGDGRYAPAGEFPSQSSQSSTNFFRDLVFVPIGVPDTTPPTVSITQPANNSTVSGSVTIAATAADNVGVAGVQFQVDGANLGAQVTTAPYSVSWNSTLVANGSHVLKAIASDAAGNTASASVTVTVSNSGPPPTSETLLTTQVPGEQKNNGVAWELGVRVVSDVAGQITALRFWKTAGENGPHIGNVWSATGQLLATVTFANETASGWQQQALGASLGILANTEYVVSVSTGPNGYYAATAGFFTTSLVNADLTALADDGRYAPAGEFPSQSSQSSTNFFRDLVFVPATSGPIALNSVGRSHLRVRLDRLGPSPKTANPVSK